MPSYCPDISTHIAWPISRPMNSPTNKNLMNPRQSLCAPAPPLPQTCPLSTSCCPSADRCNKNPTDHIHKIQTLLLEKNFQNIPCIHASWQGHHAIIKSLCADCSQNALSKL